MSPGNTGQASPPNNPPSTAQEKPKKVSPSLSACKTALSADWQLSDRDFWYAKSKGWPDARIAEPADRFRAHALANGRRQLDWAAAWRNWVNSPYQKQNGGAHGRRHGSVLDAFDRLGERLNAQGSFAELYVPGSSGPTPLRLDQDVRPANLKLVQKK